MWYLTSLHQSNFAAFPKREGGTSVVGISAFLPLYQLNLVFFFDFFGRIAETRHMWYLGILTARRYVRHNTCGISGILPPGNT